MGLISSGYCPVRKSNDDGHEWLDYLEISGSVDGAQKNAAKGNDDCPQFAIANPVVRIAQVEITEVCKH